MTLLPKNLDYKKLSRRFYSGDRYVCFGWAAASFQGSLILKSRLLRKKRLSLPKYKPGSWLQKDYSLSISVRARTEPNRVVDVSAEVSGTVVSLPVERGELVETGDIICELSEEDRPELVEQARTALNRAQLDYEGAQRLQNWWLSVSLRNCSGRSRFGKRKGYLQACSVKSSKH